MSSHLSRPALAIGVGLTLLLAGAATAAPAKTPAKPVCNLISDPKGDTFALRSQDTAGQYGPQEDGMDIVSGDVASDAKTLTGVLRVANLSAVVPSSPGGVSFDINFLSATSDAPLYIRAVVTPAGATAEAGSRQTVAVTSLSTALGAGTVVVDKPKNEVRFSFPVALFASVGGLKPGSKLVFGDITTGRAITTRAVFADVATEAKSYTVGSPSCVVPGK